MAGDSWLSDYDNCAQLGQQIMVKINERNKNQRTSSAYTKLSAHVRTSMKQFSGDVNKLRQSLLRASSSYHITQREVERRQIMIDSLTTKEKQLDQAFRNESGSSRSSLLGAETFSSNDPWGMSDEPEQFRGVGNADIQTQQQDVIREQDEGLEALSHVISKQKQMAVDIGNEVDDQNILIDDITDRTDRTGDRLMKETRHIKIVDKKSATCGYWVVIILLFIAMIVIVAVPYHGKA
ncbi:syntaxin-8-like [Gigantopelta aegis]|uniref:syntaxin-8-like n=1 Tax=Gigantopelta aegis TaxID=1735272 RepID=UPI001B8890E3|nr:syntaxin-8-like [Gigantopelta aegis]